jgi:hypothetical protein
MMDRSRRCALKAGLAAGSLFLPQPWAWVWAQSEGTVKLLKAPKVALVVGNGKYKDAPELKNPPNDARAMGEALKGAGFEVTMRLDTGREELVAAIRDYVHAVEQKKCVGLFYFAGHGVQLAWRNYMLPVDAVIDKIDDMARQSVDIERLMQGLSKADNPMNVIILDACRENPFGKDFRVEHKGLSQMDAPARTLLAYATSPGNVASDGEGANGLYTENLLREVKVPEAKIEDVFKRVRLAVRRKTAGAQIPWESTSLEEDFWFLPPKELKKISDSERERRFKEELALWAPAEKATAPGPIEEYLRRYPNGNFSELAQFRLDRVLAAQGEKRIEIVQQKDNPYTQGSADANTRWRVGNTYAYRERDLYANADWRQASSSVSAVSDDLVTFSDGYQIDLLGNVRRYADGRTLSANQSYPSEFAVGKRWTTRWTLTTPRGDEFYNQADVRITSRENITVPAGEFRTFRIEFEGSGYGAAPVRFKVVRWMAPENTARDIAYERYVTVGGRVTDNLRQELVSYKEN